MSRSSLREQIEEATGMDFGMHKSTAFLTFRITKTDSHKVTYNPGLRPDWVLYNDRHPKPTPPYHPDLNASSDRQHAKPPLVSATKKTRRGANGY